MSGEEGAKVISSIPRNGLTKSYDNGLKVLLRGCKPCVTLGVVGGEFDGLDGVAELVATFNKSPGTENVVQHPGDNQPCCVEILGVGGGDSDRRGVTTAS